MRVEPPNVIAQFPPIADMEFIVGNLQKHFQIENISQIDSNQVVLKLHESLTARALYGCEIAVGNAGWILLTTGRGSEDAEMEAEMGTSRMDLIERLEKYPQDSKGKPEKLTATALMQVPKNA